MSENAEKDNKWPPELPCLLCGDFKELLPDKNSKPYFTCNQCGVQCFIRGRVGIRQVIKFGENPKYLDLFTRAKILENAEVLQLVAKIEALDASIKDSDEFINFDESKAKKVSSLKEKRKHCHKRLNDLLQNQTFNLKKE